MNSVKLKSQFMNLLSVHCNCSINNEVQTKWIGDLLDQSMILMILAPFGLKRSGQGEIIDTWPRVHKYNKGTQISFRLVFLGHLAIGGEDCGL
jgi:hypothetical protein